MEEVFDIFSVLVIITFCPIICLLLHKRTNSESNPGIAALTTVHFALFQFDYSISNAYVEFPKATLITHWP